MKYIILIAIALTSVSSLAKDKKSRAPASAESGKCQEQAAEAALGAIKGLGQNVELESIKTLSVRGHLEIYEVQLKGSEETFETKSPITVKLKVNESSSLTEGHCSLRGIEMPLVIFDK